jgi:hypothetical protein
MCVTAPEPNVIHLPNEIALHERGRAEIYASQFAVHKSAGMELGSDPSSFPEITPVEHTS